MIVLHDANTPHSLIFDICETPEQFTVLAVHMWFVVSEGDDIEDVGSLVEDTVHFFQGAMGGLWEEEEDDWEDSGVAVVVSTS